MNTNNDLAIHLSPGAFSTLSHQAAAAGITPAELAAAVVESIYGGEPVALPDAAAARAKFEQCFGSVDLGRSVGVANDAIDADLASEYGAAAGSA